MRIGQFRCCVHTTSVKIWLFDTQSSCSAEKVCFCVYILFLYIYNKINNLPQDFPNYESDCVDSFSTKPEKFQTASSLTTPLTI